MWVSYGAHVYAYSIIADHSARRSQSHFSHTVSHTVFQHCLLAHKLRFKISRKTNSRDPRPYTYWFNIYTTHNIQRDDYELHSSISIAHISEDFQLKFVAHCGYLKQQSRYRQLFDRPCTQTQKLYKHHRNAHSEFNLQHNKKKNSIRRVIRWFMLRLLFRVVFLHHRVVGSSASSRFYWELFPLWNGVTRPAAMCGWSYQLIVLLKPHILNIRIYIKCTHVLSKLN